ncbi:MAG: chemotaxis protein [Caloramator sp.]|nr:chemotaxis protein [Caloramator sp.]
MNTSILLEAGTGEVEILEFVVGSKHYGINVIKVKEVLEVSNITKMPGVPPQVLGLTLIRGNVITVIDLKYVLDNIVSSIEREGKKRKTILCEFNKLKVAFDIDDVVRIHRIRWEQIKKPDEISENSLVIGNIVLQDKIILLLDFEKIVTDISPSAGISKNRIEDIEYKDRKDIKIVLAEDSILIKNLLKETLLSAGFEKIKFFDDGKQAFDYLNDLAEAKGERFIEDVNIVITDIEMPQMDGHTFTRKIKEHKFLRKLPVIIFSSLITDDLKHKGESVGANAQVTKPEIGQLVGLIDKYVKEVFEEKVK